MSHSESTDTSSVTTSAAAKLFDIRLLIGGLFTFYGVALGIYSFFTSQAEIDKAAGININLWLGIGMLVLGLLFLLWRRLDPVVHVEPNPTDAPRHPGGH
jgi:xanthine/uracil/vitamin C permease (AzgA family)